MSEMEDTQVENKGNKRKRRCARYITVIIILLVVGYLSLVGFFNYIHKQPTDYEAHELKKI